MCEVSLGISLFWPKSQRMESAISGPAGLGHVCIEGDISHIINVNTIKWVWHDHAATAFHIYVQSVDKTHCVWCYSRTQILWPCKSSVDLAHCFNSLDDRNGKQWERQLNTHTHTPSGDGSNCGCSSTWWPEVLDGTRITWKWVAHVILKELWRKQLGGWLRCFALWCTWEGQWSKERQQETLHYWLLSKLFETSKLRKEPHLFGGVLEVLQGFKIQPQPPLWSLLASHPPTALPPPQPSLLLPPMCFPNSNGSCFACRGQHPQFVLMTSKVVRIAALRDTPALVLHSCDSPWHDQHSANNNPLLLFLLSFSTMTKHLSHEVSAATELLCMLVVLHSRGKLPRPPLCCHGNSGPDMGLEQL